MTIVFLLFAIGLYQVFKTDRISELNEKIDIAEKYVMETHENYSDVKLEWEANIVSIEKKYKELMNSETSAEQKKINTAKEKWQKANASLNALYAEKQRIMWGSRADIQVPIYHNYNPDRDYKTENMDRLFAWVKDKEGRPYTLGAKGWDKGFDCSGLFSSFARWNGGVTHEDMIYKLSAHHIFNKGKEVGVENLQKGDFIYWTKPEKMYMAHIAMVVEPLKDGKIKIFDASPEFGVVERTIDVKIQSDNSYRNFWNNKEYKVVGGTNYFLSMELDKIKEKSGNM